MKRGHQRLIITPFANGEVRKIVARWGGPDPRPVHVRDARPSHYFSALGRCK